VAAANRVADDVAMMVTPHHLPDLHDPAYPVVIPMVAMHAKRCGIGGFGPERE
jgi:hypothetical protein